MKRTAAAPAHDDRRDEPWSRRTARPPHDDEEDQRPSRSNSRGRDAKPGVNNLWLFVVAAIAVSVLLLCGGAGLLALGWGLSRRANPLPQNADGSSQRAGAPDAGDGLAREPVFDGPFPDITPVPAGATPVLVLDPRGHTSTVRKILFTPDGSRIVSLGWDKTARVWDANTGEPLSTIFLPVGPGDEGTLEAAAFSPDGKHLALGGRHIGEGKKGHFFYVVSPETGVVETALGGHINDVTALAYSRDGALLAAATTEARVFVYEVAGWRKVADLRAGDAMIRQLAFGPTARQLACACKDGAVRVLDPQDPKAVKIIPAHGKGGCNALVWSSDGKMIVTGGSDGVIGFWNAAGEPIDRVAVSHEGTSTQIATLDLSRDGSKVVYGGIDQIGRAGLIDAAAPHKVRDFTSHSNTVQTVQFSPDGKLVVSSGGDNHETFLWKADDLQVVHRLHAAGKTAWAVGWGRDGKSIAWGNTNRGSTALAMTQLERTFHLNTLEFGGAPDGSFIRAILRAGPYTLEPLDLYRFQVKVDGRPTVVLRSPIDNERLDSATLVPGERAVVCGLGNLYMMDLRTAKVLREYKGHTSQVCGIATSFDGKFFITGSSDETIRIWSLERDTPLLSLFFAGDEWIAWTPEGYYASSPNGERLMGWLVNNGIERNALYYPAVQFRASLYQPELIRLLPSAGSVAEAMAQAARAGRPINSVQLNQVLPPAVSIASPAVVPGGVKATAATMELKAAARSTGEHPVVAMRLLMDGRPYQGQAGVRVFDKPKLGTVGTVWSVALPPGRHTFTVQAESAVSKGLSQPVEVVSADNGELPTLYMVAVGVSAYPGKMRLNYAASDAQLIAGTFREKANGVFKRAEVHVVTDRDATRARILQEMDWLAQVMTPRDVGVLFFSGHGARDDEGTFFLVPVDASPRNVLGTCVPGDLVKQRLAAIPGKVIAMLDCCHSGTVAEDFKVTRPDNLVRDLVTDDYGVVVMCASLGTESALESRATKAGFFTLSVTEGLTGGADYNHDGVVYIHELDQYAAARVPELSGGRQHTVTGKPPGIRSFPLSRP